MNEMKYSFSIELLEKFILVKFNKTCTKNNQIYIILPDIGNVYTQYHQSDLYKNYIQIHYHKRDMFYIMEKDMEFFLKSINTGIVPQSIIDEIIEFSISNL